MISRLSVESYLKLSLFSLSLYGRLDMQIATYHFRLLRFQNTASVILELLVITLTLDELSSLANVIATIHKQLCLSDTAISIRLSVIWTMRLCLSALVCLLRILENSTFLNSKFAQDKVKAGLCCHFFTSYRTLFLKMETYFETQLTYVS